MQTYTVTYHIKEETYQTRVTEDITASSLQDAEQTVGGKLTAGNVRFIVIPRNDGASQILPCDNVLYAFVQLKDDTIAQKALSAARTRNAGEASGEGEGVDSTRGEVLEIATAETPQASQSVPFDEDEKL